MKRLVVICVILLGPLNDDLSFAIETAPRISDMEIIERLTSLEEG